MMKYASLPKVELHLHLDCSLSYAVAHKINPSLTYTAYKNSFIAPAKCTDLTDYLKRASKGYQLMQTQEQLRWVTYDLFEQLKADHVIYAEIRFAPLLHTLKGLTPEEIVECVNQAVEECIVIHGIEAGIILCTLRNYNEAQSMQTVKLVEKYKGTRVVGFDIAADEANYSIDNHIKAFQYAKDHSIHCTAHAGEAKGADSVWETLEHFAPLRIGHGVRSVEDATLLDFLQKKQIHLEICPSSNIQVDVFDSIKDHSIHRIFNSGISLSINTDARTISNVTLTDEYQLLEKTFGWTLAHFKKCNLEAIAHSFASDKVKRSLQSKIEEAYVN
ncbi:MAG: adenosine deaminase [Saprospiraceae bacterium]|nr:adenosine deaminase [Saprospiraceae bacterium]